MSIGLFTDKNKEPSDKDIIKAIGPMAPVWNELISFIRGNFAVDEDLKFLYGKKYGWALRFRIKGKLLTSLYPTAGGFTVQIILDKDAVETALRSELSKNARHAINRANPYPEGRWLFIPVETDLDIKSIQFLLSLKRKP